MQKTLITIDNLDEYTCRVSSKMYFDPAAMVMTPGAKDKLAEKGIAVIYGPCPDGDNCQAHGSKPYGATASSTLSGDERLFYGIASILQSDYGITDDRQLKQLSCKAASIIKQNL